MITQARRSVAARLQEKRKTDLPPPSHYPIPYNEDVPMPASPEDDLGHSASNPAASFDTAAAFDTAATRAAESFAAFNDNNSITVQLEDQGQFISRAVYPTYEIWRQQMHGISYATSVPMHFELKEGEEAPPLRVQDLSCVLRTFQDCMMEDGLKDFFMLSRKLNAAENPETLGSRKRKFGKLVDMYDHRAFLALVGAHVNEDSSVGAVVGTGELRDDKSKIENTYLRRLRPTPDLLGPCCPYKIRDLRACFLLRFITASCPKKKIPKRVRRAGSVKGEIYRRQDCVAAVGGVQSSSGGCGEGAVERSEAVQAHIPPSLQVCKQSGVSVGARPQPHPAIPALHSLYSAFHTRAPTLRLHDSRSAPLRSASLRPRTSRTPHSVRTPRAPPAPHRRHVSSRLLRTTATGRPPRPRPPYRTPHPASPHPAPLRTRSPPFTLRTSLRKLVPAHTPSALHTPRTSTSTANPASSAPRKPALSNSRAACWLRPYSAPHSTRPRSAFMTPSASPLRTQAQMSSLSNPSPLHREELTRKGESIARRRRREEGASVAMRPAQLSETLPGHCESARTWRELLTSLTVATYPVIHGSSSRFGTTLSVILERREPLHCTRFCAYSSDALAPPDESTPGSQCN
ncbi:hypothetical protein B0H17DRAFT_1177678 [Mycena rosella]|uniref:Uncharacterized protein n=1 Tax=Mycena rosella TaxID=1033263 RepID=A0AAD7DT45_MYCRO|nr:hypothetical protein B0H17DRAFT_1177678 [Mycena rosella]